MSHHTHLLSNPIIFIGPGRSGSTVISEFIMEHELLAWPTYYLELSPRAHWSNHLRVLFDNSFWRISGEKAQINRTRLFNTLLPRPAEAFAFWEHISRQDIDFSRDFLLDQKASKAERKRIRSVFFKLVSAQRRQRLAIKLTGPGRITYLQSIFPDAIFINVVREPCCTVRSLLKVPFWKDQGMHQLWWTGAYTETEQTHYEQIRHDPELSTAFQLDKILTTTQYEAQQNNANMMTIQYEDFIANPAATVQQILQFTGLPTSIWVTRKLNNTPVRNHNCIKSKTTPIA